MIQAIVALIADDADDLVPWSSGTGSHALAERSRWLVPILARERLGNHDDGPLLDGSRFQVIERPATTRLPIVSKYPGADALEAPQRRERALRHRERPRRRAELPLSSPSIVIDEERPTEATPGTCARRSAMRWCVRAACSRIGDEALRDGDAERLHLLRLREARLRPGASRRRSGSSVPRRPSASKPARPVPRPARCACDAAPGRRSHDRPPSLSAAALGVPNLSDGNQTEQHAAQHRDAPA